jgi:hypothetical protein
MAAGVPSRWILIHPFFSVLLAFDRICCCERAPFCDEGLLQPCSKQLRRITEIKSLFIMKCFYFLFGRQKLNKLSEDVDKNQT